MKRQDDPITEDEWALMRVHQSHFVDIKTPEIQLYAFKPTVKGDFVDETGISLYRQAFITVIVDVLAKVAAEKMQVRFATAVLINDFWKPRYKLITLLIQI